MSFITLKNTPIEIDLAQVAIDNGWTVSGSVAYHDRCFPGYIELLNNPVQENTTYVVEYEVVEHTFGSVNVIVGGVSGASVSANGLVTQTIVVPNNPADLLVKFYSNGGLGVKYFNIYPLVENANNGKVLGFNTDNNIWTTYYSGDRENMLKFNNDFYAFQNGKLWIMNKNILRNNFFGVQYTSRITLVVNTNPTEVKNYFSIRQKSNKPWGVPSIIIPPSEGKANGMESLIKVGNFEKLNNGDLFANFLRDKSDPRFVDETIALFKGALLQGNYAIVTFENTSTEEIRTLSIDFLISKQELTY